MDSRICIKCKIEKPFNLFFKCKSKKYGVSNQCKECDKKYWQSDRGKELKKQEDKRYYEKHKKEIAQWSKEYYQKNKNHILDRIKKYRLNNKDKIRAYWNSPKGKEIKRGKDARYRELEYEKLFDNPFSDEVVIHWHHIDNRFVVPMPKNIHEKCNHITREEHRERANVWLYYLYGMDFDRFLHG